MSPNKIKPHGHKENELDTYGAPVFAPDAPLFLQTQCVLTTMSILLL